MNITYNGAPRSDGLRLTSISLTVESNLENTTYHVTYHVVFKNYKLFCILHYGVTDSFYASHQEKLLDYDIQDELDEHLRVQLTEIANKHYFISNNAKDYVQNTDKKLFISDPLYNDFNHYIKDLHANTYYDEMLH